MEKRESGMPMVEVRLAPFEEVFKSNRRCNAL
jgi:hypothetical protein